MVTGRRWLGDRLSPLDLSIARTTAPLAALAPPLLAAAAALALTRSAMLPGVAFWDTAEFQTVGPVMGTAHSPGYPTYVILGWLASLLLTPFGDPAFRMNLFSGLCVAVAAALAAVLVRQLTGRGAIGAAAGIGLAATPHVWRVGTHAEPHSLHLALVALLLVLLVGWDRARRTGSPRADRWLMAAAAAFGLAAGNHSLTLLLAPAIGVYVIAVQPTILGRPRLIATCVAALVGTLALVYLELPLRAGWLRAPLVYGRPDTWDGFWYIVLAQQFLGSVSHPLADLPRKAGELATLAQGELGVLDLLLPLALLLPAAAIVTIRRCPRYALLTGLAVLVTVVFSASYPNADIGRYYVGPLLMAWTWLAVLAATTVEAMVALAGLRPLRRPTNASMTPAAGGGLPGAERVLHAEPRPRGAEPGLPDVPPAGRAMAAVLAVLLALPAVIAIPARHGALDQRSDQGARLWLDSALDRIAQNAVVVSWWSYSTPLWYAQHVEGRRPDIFVVDDRTRLDMELGEATDVIARYLGQRPVYVIRANQHDLGLVLAQFQLREGSGPASNVYEVVGPVRAGT